MEYYPEGSKVSKQKQPTSTNSMNINLTRQEVVDLLIRRKVDREGVTITSNSSFISILVALFEKDMKRQPNDES